VVVVAGDAIGLSIPALLSPVEGVQLYDVMLFAGNSIDHLKSVPISKEPRSVIFNDHVPLAAPVSEENDCEGANEPVNGAEPLLIEVPVGTNLVLIKSVPFPPTELASIMEEPEGEINSIFKSPFRVLFIKL
jgi:hypothetical protein